MEHLVTVAGGGEDALSAGPAGRGVGAGLEILTQEIIFSNYPQEILLLSTHLVFLDDRVWRLLVSVVLIVRVVLSSSNPGGARDGG